MKGNNETSTPTPSPVPRLPHVPKFPGPMPFFLSHTDQICTHTVPKLGITALLGWGPLLPFKRYMCGGCSFVKACRGDVFGWLGRLAGKIHQPASSTLASPNHVLICQSVGFPYTYSSIFVSDEIAFVFLCLLINPSVDLWSPHSTYLVSSLEIELGAVVTPKENNPRS